VKIVEKMLEKRAKKEVICEKLLAVLISEIKAMGDIDGIKQVIFAEQTLKYSAKTFRKKYFNLLHYALKYNSLISAVVSSIASVIATIILLSLSNS
jgi:hypothetical protein